MKKMTFTLLLLLPALAIAQNFQNMSEADAQKLMQQMQKVQACMAGIDEAEIKKFEQRANQMQARVDALCTSGKRDEAQEEGIAFAKEVSSNEAMQKMQECSKMIEGVIPGMPGMPPGSGDKGEQRHICDN